MGHPITLADGSIYAMPTGHVDTSHLRFDFLRKTPNYPGGTYQGVVDDTCQMQLTVGSSGSPIAYSWGPPTGEVWVLSRINIYVQDGQAQFIATNFGAISPLAIGCLWRMNRRLLNTAVDFFSVKNNVEWCLMAGVDVEERKYGSGDDVLQVRWTITKGIATEKFIMLGDNGDVLEMLVRDDLSDLTQFHCYAQGYKI